MVLDEPVDGLDPVMRRQIWGVICQRLRIIIHCTGFLA